MVGDVTGGGDVVAATVVVTAAEGGTVAGAVDDEVDDVSEHPAVTPSSTNVIATKRLTSTTRRQATA